MVWTPAEARETVLEVGVVVRTSWVYLVPLKYEFKLC